MSPFTLLSARLDVLADANESHVTGQVRRCHRVGGAYVHDPPKRRAGHGDPTTAAPQQTTSAAGVR